MQSTGTPTPPLAMKPRGNSRGYLRSLLTVLCASWLGVTLLFRVSAGIELLLFGLLLFGAALILYAGRRGLTSPIFYYDLVRTARRGQQQAHRFLFAVFLAGALFLTYSSHTGSFDLTFGQTVRIPRPLRTEFDPAFGPTERVSRNQLAEFGWSFVSKVLILQYLAVLLVTPAYVATALPQEKQQRTLEFILTTDLSDQEIVAGVLVSRLANLFLLVITGLPILALLQFIGGVDPRAVLAGFVMILLTMMSAGSASILASVFSDRPWPALCSAYVWVFVLTAFSAVLCVPLNSPSWYLMGPGATTAATGGAELVLTAMLSHGALTWFLSLWAVREFRAASLGQLPLSGSGPPPAARQPASLLRRPVLVESAAGWQVMSAAAAGEAQGWGPYPPSPDGESLETDRPLQIPWDSRHRRRVGEDALLWKETYSLMTREKLFGQFTGERLALALLGFIALFVFHLWIDGNRLDRMPEADYANNAFRGCNVVAFSLILFAVAVNAAGRVSREREQQTLDVLRAIPVGLGDILLAKWLGSLRIVLPFLGLLALVWALALVFSALHAAALPLLLAGSLVYLAFMSSLGLWLSTMHRTTLRSTLFAVLAALLFLTSTTTLLAGRHLIRSGTAWHERLYDHVISPGQTLWTLSFASSALLGKGELNTLPDILAAVVAVHLYILLTAVLWASMLRRLEGEKGPAPKRPGDAQTTAEFCLISHAHPR